MVGGVLRLQRLSSVPETVCKCEHSQRSGLGSAEDPVLWAGLTSSKCILGFKPQQCMFNDIFSIAFMRRRVRIVIDSFLTVDIYISAKGEKNTSISTGKLRGTKMMLIQAEDVK